MIYIFINKKPYSSQIPVVMDLPVGNNLQDHVMADGIEFYTPYSGISITAAKAENFLQSWSYSLFGGGKIFMSFL